MRVLPLSLLHVVSVNSELKDAAERGGTMYFTHYKPKLKHLQSIGDDNTPAIIYLRLRARSRAPWHSLDSIPSAPVQILYQATPNILHVRL